jgi:ubiquinol-cytochrome c reductase core subunit 2
LACLDAGYLTDFPGFEFQEEVDPVLHLKQAKVGHNVPALALDAAHAVAFHSGLGAAVYPSPTTPLKGYLDEHKIAAFADSVYGKSNIALIGDGATAAALSKWTEQFFKNTPTGSAVSTPATKYYGGESRTAHTGGNSVVIAFPGSSFGTYKPESAVLAALLGSQSSVKWAPGFSLLSKVASATPALAASATNLAYSDAGLLTVQISGPAAAVRSASQEAVKAIKSISEGAVSKEDLTKAIAKAKFDALSSSETGVSTILQIGSGIVHAGKPFQIAETVKAIEAVSVDSLKTVSLPLASCSSEYSFFRV